MNPLLNPVELPGLRVTVDQVVYRLLPVAEKPHSFVYFITVHNNAEVPVTLLRRKWVVTHAGGESDVLIGEGIVGQTPEIAPGDVFSYNSQHLIPGPHAIAAGAYLGFDHEGRAVVVRIPPFRMVVPGRA